MLTNTFIKIIYLKYKYLYILNSTIFHILVYKGSEQCKHNINSFPPWTFTTFTPWCHILTTPPFPWWQLLTLFYSAVILAGLFCLYTTIIILKLDFTWFTCVINKTKHQVDLPKFKMVARSTRIFGFKTGVLGIIFYKQWCDAYNISNKWSIYERFVRF